MPFVFYSGYIIERLNRSEGPARLGLGTYYMCTLYGRRPHTDLFGLMLLCTALYSLFDWIALFIALNYMEHLLWIFKTGFVSLKATKL